MPAQKSCAISILGVYALQRIIFKQQDEVGPGAGTPPQAPGDL
jgi:hypothetical protein